MAKDGFASLALAKLGLGRWCSARRRAKIFGFRGNPALTNGWVDGSTQPEKYWGRIMACLMIVQAGYNLEFYRAFDWENDGYSWIAGLVPQDMNREAGRLGMLSLPVNPLEWLADQTAKVTYAEVPPTRPAQLPTLAELNRLFLRTRARFMTFEDLHKRAVEDWPALTLADVFQILDKSRFRGKSPDGLKQNALELAS